MINRQQVFINGELPATITDKCIDDSGKCIFPVIAELNAHDGRLESLSNTKAIQSRWLTAKERLYLNYKGPVLDKIVARMEQSLSSAEGIINAVKNDLFFQLFFFPLYAGHRHIKGIEMSHAFSIVPNRALVKFTCTREIMNNNEDGMSIEVKGKTADKRSFNDIAIANSNAHGVLETEDHCEGGAHLGYELFANGMMKSVNGYLEIRSAEDNFRRTEVNITQNEKASITDKDVEPAIQPVTYAKKKTFWDRFK